MCVKVRLLFFAKARELTGISETEVTDLFAVNSTNPAENSVETSEITTTGSGLFDAVFNAFPELSPIKDSVILAHNLEYIDVVDGKATISVKDGDEIAVIPPVSGG